MTPGPVVVDASVLVDWFVREELAGAILLRIDGAALHAPAHVDHEVLSALGRLHRAGAVSAATVSRHLEDLAEAPIERHPVAPLVAGAWRRRQRLRLADALYVELATELDVPLVTTDLRLARTARIAEAVEV